MIKLFGKLWCTVIGQGYKGTHIVCCKEYYDTLEKLKSSYVRLNRVGKAFYIKKRQNCSVVREYIVQGTSECIALHRITGIVQDQIEGALSTKRNNS